jgi:hypothetical protein
VKPVYQLWVWRYRRRDIKAERISHHHASLLSLLARRESRFCPKRPYSSYDAMPGQVWCSSNMFTRTPSLADSSRHSLRAQDDNRTAPLTTRSNVSGVYQFKPLVGASALWVKYIVQLSTPVCRPASVRAQIRTLQNFRRIISRFPSPPAAPITTGLSSSLNIGPFGYPRISVSWPLPAAFRSFARPSSPPGA